MMETTPIRQESGTPIRDCIDLDRSALRDKLQNKTGSKAFALPDTIG